MKFMNPEEIYPDNDIDDVHKDEKERGFFESEQIILKSISKLFTLSANLLEKARKDEIANKRDYDMCYKYYNIFKKINKTKDSKKYVEKMKKLKYGFTFFNEDCRGVLKAKLKHLYHAKEFDFVEHVENIVDEWGNLDDEKKEIWHEIAVDEFLEERLPCNYRKRKRIGY